MSETELFTYDQLVAVLSKSQKYGFLSPQPIENQIEHSRGFIDLCPSSTGRILDLGAGGGLPSLVWLHVRPESILTAVDAMKKRTDFLDEVRSEFLGITDRLEVINGRAEEIAQKEIFRQKRDLVVARGFGPPAITAECASAFLKVGGHLVVSGRPENELSRWNVEGLNVLGCTLIEVRSGERSHAVIIKKITETDKRYPRRTPVMKKAPLWTS